MNTTANFMNWWQALLLGALQGFTEYLPVSSSGHLAIAELAFGLYMPVSVDIFLHLATLIPTIWLFRQKIGSLVYSVLYLLSYLINHILNQILNRPQQTKRKLVDWDTPVGSNLRYIALVLLVTAFTFAIAYPQKNLNLKFQPLLIASGFLFTGVLLQIQHLLSKNSLSMPIKQLNADTDYLQNISWQKAISLAICLGIAQGIASSPGVSRSGMTISIALLLGFKSHEAGEFSFIISIPIIVGALLLDAKELVVIANSNALAMNSILFAFIAACVSGFIALRLLLFLLAKGNFHIFSIYLFLLSSFTFWYFY